MPTADTSSHPGVDFLRAICFSSSIDISVLFIRVLRFHVIAAQQLVATVSLRNRLCEKSVVQSACRTSVSVSSIRKSIALATSVRRRQLRKQFCASLAHATFHTAWFAGTTSGYFPSHRQRLHAHLAQPLWLTTLTMIPWGSLTKNRRTPHGSSVRGYTIEYPCN